MLPPEFYCATKHCGCQVPKTISVYLQIDNWIDDSTKQLKWNTQIRVLKQKKNIVNRSKQIKWLVSLYNVLPTLKVCLHSVMIIKFALHFLSVLFEFNSNISDSHWFLCWKRMNVVCCDLVVRAAQNSRVSITLSFWLCDFGSVCTLNGIFFTFIYLHISAFCSIGTRFCSFEIECRTTLSCATENNLQQKQSQCLSNRGDNFWTKICFSHRNTITFVHISKFPSRFRNYQAYRWKN